MSVPNTTKEWSITGTSGFDDLKFESSAPVPAVGDKDVLVKIEGVSLNYRDLIIPQGKYPFAMSLPRIPLSDGAGTVVATGAKCVRGFKPGDKVVTLFNQSHIGGALNAQSSASGLGGALDGTLREYGTFDEEGLVLAPRNLSATESSTLTCAGLTAWNGLFGLSGKALKPGDWVVCQGTGGVSVFGVQFAKAAGATVIATTSSDSKAEFLKSLGADHVLNYRTNPAWGSAARELTPGKQGVDHILEVSGPANLKQSLECIAIEGVITIIGFVGGVKDSPSFLEVLSHLCTVRGILVGSREQMEEMCRAVEAAGEKLRPVVDGRAFEGIEKAREAYEYMSGKGHVGKVCIKIG